MCGIAGIFGPINPDVEAALRAMTEAQAHRGPDDEGIYVDDTVGLSHRRLSIIDLSPKGHQPMWDDTGRLAIIFNGEVYNFISLREQLRAKGYTFNSNTDTEVILKAFKEWGQDCVSLFNGMFTLAIYDKTEKRLFLARDRLGIKPLYTARTESGYFVFASEIRALLESRLIQRRLNVNELGTYLKYQTVHPPATLIEGVEMMLPGTYTWVSSEGIRTEQYWHLMNGESKEAGAHDAESSRAEVRRQLASAVERRLVSDVPIGAFLSGGIDSSLIVALMSRAASRAVKTFTVAFDDAAYNDREYARLVADRYKTDHTEVTLIENDLLEQVAQALASMDHPSADGINTYIVSKAAKASGLTVVLSGLGGDEFFAGYSTFNRLIRQQRALPFWKYTPHILRAGAGALIQMAKPNIEGRKIKDMLISDGSLEKVYPITRQYFSDRQISALLDSTYIDSDPYEQHLADAYRTYPSSNTLTSVSFAEATTYMHNVLLRDTDQMSMAHALEIRVPFLDHELASYVMGVSDSAKQSNGIPKRLLVEACRDLLPEAIIHRPKQGFIMPFADWIRGPLKKECLRHLETIAAVPALDSSVIWSYWDDFQAGSPRTSWSRVWLLVAFGSWYRRLLS